MVWYQGLVQVLSQSLLRLSWVANLNLFSRYLLSAHTVSGLGFISEPSPLLSKVLSLKSLCCDGEKLNKHSKQIDSISTSPPAPGSILHGMEDWLHYTILHKRLECLDIGVCGGPGTKGMTVLWVKKYTAGSGVCTPTYYVCEFCMVIVWRLRASHWALRKEYYRQPDL